MSYLSPIGSVATVTSLGTKRFFFSLKTNLLRSTAMSLNNKMGDSGRLSELSGNVIRYLEDMGRTVAVTLLTLTPENAEHASEAAARLAHASARGAIGAWAAAEAGRMARRDLATAFYPGRIEADPKALTAVVSGELATWVGREQVSRQRKRYRLSFRVDAGRIGLLRFEELEEEK